MTQDERKVPGALAPYSTPRLVPHIIDSKAESMPGAACMYTAVSTDPRDGWQPVTWKMLANAINHAAAWLHAAIGVPEPDTFPTVTYLGPNDGRYYALLVGAQKAGYKAFFVSPRNTVQGQVNLLGRTQCDHFVVAPAYRPFVQDLPAHRPSLKIIEVPAYDSWYTATPATPVPFNRTYAEARWDPMVVLHTSGTTGLPKPIVSPHGMICVTDQLRDVPEFEGYKLALRAIRAVDVQRHLMAMPLFHAAGTYIFLFMAVYWDTPVVLGHPDTPLSVQMVSDCLRYAGCDCAVLPPAILAMMSESDEHIEQLKDLKYACYGGGALPPEAGNKMVEKGVRVMNWIASTECAPYLQYYQPDPKQWQWSIFNPYASGIEFRRVNSAEEPKGSEHDVYSMVIKRKDKEPGYQTWFYTFPDNDEFDTKDLWRPHPTLPHHWQHAGRGDDIIVFSNGEKLNPTSIEFALHDSPMVKGAVVVGAGKFQAGLVLEPAQSQEGVSSDEFIEKIWPVVEEANRQTVAHGRIVRHLIMMTKADKPFPRAGKGTIQRAGAVKLYEHEIDRMYEAAEKGEASALKPVEVDVSSEEALVQSITSIFKQATASASADADASAPVSIEADTDLFSAGVDSLMVINTSRQLRASLQAAGLHDTTSNKDGVNPRAFYANSTPRLLAQHILRCFSSSDSVSPNGVKPSSASDSASEIATTTQRIVDDMQAVLSKLTTNLPAPSTTRKAPATTDNQTVLVTGTTGLLGSHILAILLDNPFVSKIVCLNRATDGGASKYKSIFSASDKIEFVHIDATSPSLGLTPDVYTRLATQTDRIIHNAWPVNFNIPLSSFGPSLLGVRNIADFATACAKKPTLVFISSISSVFAYKDAPKVPEERFTDLSIAVPGGGYGQSKMLGSLILDAAAEMGGFDVAKIRVGQIAGCSRNDGTGFTSVWNKQEWLPSLVASSVYLEALPSSLGSMGNIDWVTIERIAGLCCDVAGIDGQQTATPKGAEYYHGVSPKVTDWTELREAVRESYQIPKVVELGDWVKMLEQSRVEVERMEDQQQVKRKLELNPGIKLLDTYRGMLTGGEKNQVSLDATRSMERSEAIRSAGPITGAMMKKWCKQWAFQKE